METGIMETKVHGKVPGRGGMRDRLTALAIAFAVTLVAAPGHAVDFPNVPLQSGSAYPAANVRFILDDSGSMT